MAQIFPKWTNAFPTAFAGGSFILALALVGLVWYYGSPWYTDVGYRPEQPLPFSHKLHAGDLGVDCRYCHNTVELSAHANVPPTRTCLNCHRLILPESKKLLLVRESWSEKKPIGWIRVHKSPDYCYFNHSAHLYAGIGCSDCHGPVANMEIVALTEPLSMSWCLDCHRRPEPHLRPRTELTNTLWIPPPEDQQAAFASRVIREKNIAPPEECSGCHR